MRHRRLGIALCLGAVIGVLWQGVALGSPSSDRQRLERIRGEVAAVRQSIRQQQDEIADRQAALREVERKLNEVAAAVEAAQAAVDRQRRAVDAATKQFAAYEAAAKTQEALLGRRVRALYKRGAGAASLAVFDADSPAEFTERSALAGAVLDADQTIIERNVSAQVAVDAQRRRLVHEQRKLTETLAQQQAIMDEVETLRQERLVQLTEERSRLATLREEERYLEEDSAQLQAAIARAEREARRARQRTLRAARASDGDGARHAAGASAVAGGWTWPVRRTVTSEFGPRWGRMHEGIDIAAPTGTPLAAARAGTVIYAGTMGGYGLMTLIDHGGGVVTAYAHQNRILVSKGQAVSAGQQIGEIGSTGNSTGPHVHFEVRVGGAARNPRGYLP